MAKKVEIPPLYPIFAIARYYDTISTVFIVLPNSSKAY